MRWVVVSGQQDALMMHAFGPFESMEAALDFLNRRPDGYISNLYQLVKP
jgi:hypothetical protein